MDNLATLEQEINQIKERNSRVETDKAWETSFSRKSLIVVLTYFIIVIFFYFIDVSRPFVNAIVPAIGFIVSTLSIPIFKKLWIKYWYKKHLS